MWWGGSSSHNFSSALSSFFLVFVHLLYPTFFRQLVVVGGKGSPAALRKQRKCLTCLASAVSSPLRTEKGMTLVSLGLYIAPWPWFTSSHPPGECISAISQGLMLPPGRRSPLSSGNAAECLEQEAALPMLPT